MLSIQRDDGSWLERQVKAIQDSQNAKLSVVGYEASVDVPFLSDLGATPMAGYIDFTMTAHGKISQGNSSAAKHAFLERLEQGTFGEHVKGYTPFGDDVLQHSKLAYMEVNGQVTGFQISTANLTPSAFSDGTYRDVRGAKAAAQFNVNMTGTDPVIGAEFKAAIDVMKTGRVPTSSKHLLFSQPSKGQRDIQNSQLQLINSTRGTLQMTAATYSLSDVETYEALLKRLNSGGKVILNIGGIGQKDFDASIEFAKLLRDESRGGQLTVRAPANKFWYGRQSTHANQILDMAGGRGQLQTARFSAEAAYGTQINVAFRFDDKNLVTEAAKLNDQIFSEVQFSTPDRGMVNLNSQRRRMDLSNYATDQIWATLSTRVGRGSGRGNGIYAVGMTVSGAQRMATFKAVTAGVSDPYAKEAMYNQAVPGIARLGKHRLLYESALRANGQWGTYNFPIQNFVQDRDEAQYRLTIGERWATNNMARGIAKVLGVTNMELVRQRDGRSMFTSILLNSVEAEELAEREFEYNWLESTYRPKHPKPQEFTRVAAMEGAIDAAYSFVHLGALYNFGIRSVVLLNNRAARDIVNLIQNYRTGNTAQGSRVASVAKRMMTGLNSVVRVATTAFMAVGVYGWQQGIGQLSAHSRNLKDLNRILHPLYSAAQGITSTVSQLTQLFIGAHNRMTGPLGWLTKLANHLTMGPQMMEGAQRRIASAGIGGGLRHMGYQAWLETGGRVWSMAFNRGLAAASLVSDAFSAISSATPDTLDNQIAYYDKLKAANSNPSYRTPILLYGNTFKESMNVMDVKGRAIVNLAGGALSTYVMHKVAFGPRGMMAGGAGLAMGGTAMALISAGLTAVGGSLGTTLSLGYAGAATGMYLRSRAGEATHRAIIKGGVMGALVGIGVSNLDAIGPANLPGIANFMWENSVRRVIRNNYVLGNYDYMNEWGNLRNIGQSLSIGATSVLLGGYAAFPQAPEGATAQPKGPPIRMNLRLAAVLGGSLVATGLSYFMGNRILSWISGVEYQKEPHLVGAEKYVVVTDDGLDRQAAITNKARDMINAGNRIGAMELMRKSNEYSWLLSGKGGSLIVTNVIQSGTPFSGVTYFGLMRKYDQSLHEEIKLVYGYQGPFQIGAGFSMTSPFSLTSTSDPASGKDTYQLKYQPGTVVEAISGAFTNPAGAALLLTPALISTGFSYFGTNRAVQGDSRHRRLLKASSRGMTAFGYLAMMNPMFNPLGMLSIPLELGIMGVGGAVAAAKYPDRFPQQPALARQLGREIRLGSALQAGLMLAISAGQQVMLNVEDSRGVDMERTIQRGQMVSYTASKVLQGSSFVLGAISGARIGQSIGSRFTQMSSGRTVLSLMGAGIGAYMANMIAGWMNKNDAFGQMQFANFMAAAGTYSPKYSETPGQIEIARGVGKIDWGDPLTGIVKALQSMVFNGRVRRPKGLAERMSDLFTALKGGWYASPTAGWVPTGWWSGFKTQDTDLGSVIKTSFTQFATLGMDATNAYTVSTTHDSMQRGGQEAADFGEMIHQFISRANTDQIRLDNRVPRVSGTMFYSGGGLSDAPMSVKIAVSNRMMKHRWAMNAYSYEVARAFGVYSSRRLASNAVSFSMGGQAGPGGVFFNYPMNSWNKRLNDSLLSTQRALQMGADAEFEAADDLESRLIEQRFSQRTDILGPALVAAANAYRNQNRGWASNIAGYAGVGVITVGAIYTGFNTLKRWSDQAVQDPNNQQGATGGKLRVLSWLRKRSYEQVDNVTTGHTPQRSVGAATISKVYFAYDPSRPFYQIEYNGLAYGISKPGVGATPFDRSQAEHNALLTKAQKFLLGFEQQLISVEQSLNKGSVSNALTELRALQGQLSGVSVDAHGAAGKAVSRLETLIRHIENSGLISQHHRDWIKSIVYEARQAAPHMVGLLHSDGKTQFALGTLTKAGVIDASGMLNQSGIFARIFFKIGEELGIWKNFKTQAAREFANNPGASADQAPVRTERFTPHAEGQTGRETLRQHAAFMGEPEGGVLVDRPRGDNKILSKMFAGSMTSLKNFGASAVRFGLAAANVATGSIFVLTALPRTAALMDKDNPLRDEARQQAGSQVGLVAPFSAAMTLFAEGGPSGHLARQAKLLLSPVGISMRLLGRTGYQIADLTSTLLQWMSGTPLTDTVALKNAYRRKVGPDRFQKVTAFARGIYNFETSVSNMIRSAGAGIAKYSLMGLSALARMTGSVGKFAMKPFAKTSLFFSALGSIQSNESFHFGEGHSAYKQEILSQYTEAAVTLEERLLQQDKARAEMGYFRQRWDRAVSWFNNHGARRALRQAEKAAWGAGATLGDLVAARQTARGSVLGEQVAAAEAAQMTATEMEQLAMRRASWHGAGSFVTQMAVISLTNRLLENNKTWRKITQAISSVFAPIDRMARSDNALVAGLGVGALTALTLFGLPGVTFAGAFLAGAAIGTGAHLALGNLSPYLDIPNKYLLELTKSFNVWSQEERRRLQREKERRDRLSKVGGGWITNAARSISAFGSFVYSSLIVGWEGKDGKINNGLLTGMIFGSQQEQLGRIGNVFTQGLSPSLTNIHLKFSPLWHGNLIDSFTVAAGDQERMRQGQPGVSFYHMLHPTTYGRLLTGMEEGSMPQQADTLGRMFATPLGIGPLGIDEPRVAEQFLPDSSFAGTEALQSLIMLRAIYTDTWAYGQALKSLRKDKRYGVDPTKPVSLTNAQKAEVEAYKDRKSDAYSRAYLLSAASLIGGALATFIPVVGSVIGPPLVIAGAGGIAGTMGREYYEVTRHTDSELAGVVQKLSPLYRAKLQPAVQMAGGPVVAKPETMMPKTAKPAGTPLMKGAVPSPMPTVASPVVKRSPPPVPMPTPTSPRLNMNVLTRVKPNAMALTHASPTPSPRPWSSAVVPHGAPHSYATMSVNPAGPSLFQRMNAGIQRWSNTVSWSTLRSAALLGGGLALGAAGIYFGGPTLVGAGVLAATLVQDTIKLTPAQQTLLLVEMEQRKQRRAVAREEARTGKSEESVYDRAYLRFSSTMVEDMLAVRQKIGAASGVFAGIVDGFRSAYNRVSSAIRRLFSGISFNQNWGTGFSTSMGANDVVAMGGSWLRRILGKATAYISSGFGHRGRGFHEGLDLAPEGSRITFRAPMAGIVRTISNNAGGYGTLVVIEHAPGITTRYGHGDINPNLRVGQYVPEGAALGTVASHGRSTGPHTHFELRVNGQPIDPRGGQAQEILNRYEAQKPKVSQALPVAGPRPVMGPTAAPTPKPLPDARRLVTMIGGGDKTRKEIEKNFIVAYVGSPDLAKYDLRYVNYDAILTPSSWNQMPTFLRSLKQRAEKEHKQLLLELSVHGNNGTGLKLVTTGKGQEWASVTSVAQVQKMVASSGFSPKDIVLLTDACNAPMAFNVSVDGLNREEKLSIQRQASMLARSDGHQLGKLEIVDAGPTAPDLRYAWIGSAPGVNTVNQVGMGFLRGASRSVSGIGILDLRRYRTQYPGVSGSTLTDAQWTKERGLFAELMQGSRFMPSWMYQEFLHKPAPTPTPSPPVSTPVVPSPAPSPQGNWFTQTARSALSGVLFPYLAIQGGADHDPRESAQIAPQVYGPPSPQTPIPAAVQQSAARSIAPSAPKLVPVKGDSLLDRHGRGWLERGGSRFQQGWGGAYSQFEGTQAEIENRIRASGLSKPQKDFLVSILPGALDGNKHGLPYSITLAQAALESTWGTQTPHPSNVFGIKSYSGRGVTAMTTEYEGGRAVRRPAVFAVYANRAEGVKAHNRLLLRPDAYDHYKRALKIWAETRDPVRFGYALQGGYASDPQYGASLATRLQMMNLLIGKRTTMAPAIQGGVPAGGAEGSAGTTSQVVEGGKNKVVLSFADKLRDHSYDTVRVQTSDRLPGIRYAVIAGAVLYTAQGKVVDNTEALSANAADTTPYVDSSLEHMDTSFSAIS